MTLTYHKQCASIAHTPSLTHVYISTATCGLEINWQAKLHLVDIVWIKAEAPDKDHNVSQ